MENSRALISRFKSQIFTRSYDARHGLTRFANLKLGICESDQLKLFWREEKEVGCNLGLEIGHGRPISPKYKAIFKKILGLF